jgi:ABC-2 type transport system ATP-binding protein
MSQRDIIIILSTHIVGDISSSCKHMALLNRGEVAFHGPPDDLIDMAKGHVWQIEAIDSELEVINARYPVISTIPSDTGWEVQVVADALDGYPGKAIDPNLEHAYVYFMEYKLGQSLQDEELRESNSKQESH